MLIQVVSCRWCGKKIAPDLETGQYPKRCPGRKCRRLTWNKSDQEIRDAKYKAVSTLLNNHKRGMIKKKRKINLDISTWLVKNKKPKKPGLEMAILICRWCGKKIAPDLETCIYPKRCANRMCRRKNWHEEKKTFFCKQCELNFEDQKALDRHNERRNHNGAG